MVNLDRVLPPVAPLLRPALRPFKARRRAQFAADPPVRGQVVFLGDSITAMGEWDKWFPTLPTSNRGVNGETIGEVATRLDTAFDHPAVISLMIGTNDLHGLGRSSRPADIAQQLDDLIRRIRAMAPDATLLVNSVLPRSTRFAERIRELNGRYARIADDTGATWVDLWPAMAQPDGSIRSALTRDGIHLNREGYRVWTEVLEPMLTRPSVPPA